MLRILNLFVFKLIVLSLILITFPNISNPIKSDEISMEEVTIKKRKSIFSKNYSTAKKVQSLTSKGDFEKSKKFDDGNERKLYKFNSSFP